MSVDINGRNTTGSTVLNMLLLLVAIAVLGGSNYGTYTWQHREVDKLNTKITQLNHERATNSKAAPLPTASDKYTSKKGVAIKVYTPASSSTVTSPVVVMGEVPGNWSFEASFPVKLLDAKGNVVVSAPAQLLGDWMTDKPVPFTVKLTFSNTPGGNGTLVLQKDNPSGIAANDDSVSIPINL